MGKERKKNKMPVLTMFSMCRYCRFVKERGCSKPPWHVCLTAQAYPRTTYKNFN